MWKDSRFICRHRSFAIYLRRHDDALPTVVAIATLPMVLADGGVLAQHEGLDRERGIVFKIPLEILQMMPRREDCTPEAVADAMRFLCDEWLIDVATDDTGKCILIAAALTIIERSRAIRLVACAGRRSSASLPKRLNVPKREEVERRAKGAALFHQIDIFLAHTSIGLPTPKRGSRAYGQVCQRRELREISEACLRRHL
jgi:hypothetical protein